ncbi:hypothetical protein D3C73_1188820 [compost metagenome]
MVLLHQVGIARNILNGKNVEIRSAGELGAQHGHVVGRPEVHIFNRDIRMLFLVSVDQRLIVGGCFPVPQCPF